MMTGSSSQAAGRDGSAFYRMVWRWHFYAGLFAIPFIIFLSITGSIYVFRPQIETWLDRPYDHMTAPQTATPSAVAAAVLAQNPDWRLSKYQLPRGPESAAQVLISKDGVERRLYVDRSNLKIIKSEEEQQRPMMMIFRLHGQLLAGDRGSNIVELAASWAIVMVLTGLFLWWPRGMKGLGGVLYPRLTRGGRTTLRDLHAVTGVWVSVVVLVFLFSGLPWASNWGQYFQKVRAITGTSSTTESWFAGPGAEKAALQADDTAALHAAHMASMPGMEGMPGMESMPGMDAMPPPANAFGVPTGMDMAVATASRLDFAPPVVLMAPLPGGSRWKAVSQSLNVPRTSQATIDGLSGNIISRTDFRQHQWVDRLVGYTTALHQGQLFGVVNQLLNLTLAAGLITLSVAAAMMWWRRRAPGVLGAPAPPAARGWSWALLAAILGLGLVLPEFLVSLLCVLMCEWLVLRRIPRVRNWLALSPP